MTVTVLGCEVRNPKVAGLTRAATRSVLLWLVVDVIPAAAFGHVTRAMIGACLLSVFVAATAWESGIRVIHGFNHVLLLLAGLAFVQLVYWIAVLSW